MWQLVLIIQSGADTDIERQYSAQIKEILRRVDDLKPREMVLLSLRGQNPSGRILKFSFYHLSNKFQYKRRVNIEMMMTLRVFWGMGVIKIYGYCMQKIFGDHILFGKCCASCLKAYINVPTSLLCASISIYQNLIITTLSDLLMA